jgi:hypothetical protein
MLHTFVIPSQASTSLSHGRMREYCRHLVVKNRQYNLHADETTDPSWVLIECLDRARKQIREEATNAHDGGVRSDEEAAISDCCADLLEVLAEVLDSIDLGAHFLENEGVEIAQGMLAPLLIGEEGDHMGSACKFK